MPAVDLGQLGSTQAAARSKERQGFQQIGLPGAVRTGQHDRPSAEREPDLAIVAEIRQYKTRYANAAYLGIGNAAGFLCLGKHADYMGSTAALCQIPRRPTERANLPPPRCARYPILPRAKGETQSAGLMVEGAAMQRYQPQTRIGIST